MIATKASTSGAAFLIHHASSWHGASSHRGWELPQPRRRTRGGRAPRVLVPPIPTPVPWVRKGRHECAPENPPGRPAAGAGATHSLFPRKAWAHAIPHKWGATATARPPVGSDTGSGCRQGPWRPPPDTDAGPKGFQLKAGTPARGRDLSLVERPGFRIGQREGINPPTKARRGRDAVGASRVPVTFVANVLTRAKLHAGTGKAHSTAINTAAVTAVIFSFVDRSMVSSECDANLTAALYAASRVDDVTEITLRPAASRGATIACTRKKAAGVSLADFEARPGRLPSSRASYLVSP